MTAGRTRLGDPQKERVGNLSSSHVLFRSTREIFEGGADVLQHSLEYRVEAGHFVRARLQVPGVSLPGPLPGSVRGVRQHLAVGG